MQSLAHGIISLGTESAGMGAERRRLIVQKVRGTKYRGGYHDFVIKRADFLFSRDWLRRSDHRRFAAENVNSSVKGMDAILGGGLARGTSNLFTGPPGSGKYTLALTYAIALRKEKRRSCFSPSTKV